MKQALAAQLEQSGWVDHVRRECQQSIERRGGVETVTLDQIMVDVAPNARAAIPEDVQQRMLDEIQALVKQYVK